MRKAKRRSVTGIRRRSKVPKATPNVTLSSEKPSRSNIQPEIAHGTITPTLLPSHELQRRGRRRVSGAPETEDRELASSWVPKAF